MNHKRSVIAVVAVLYVLTESTVEALLTDKDRLQLLTDQLNQRLNCRYSRDQTFDALLFAHKIGRLPLL
jgi:hypothetical protein